MKTRVKICGLTTAQDVAAACAAGAGYLGFNFFPKSPRFVTLDQARDLAVDVPLGVAKVALYVDPTDAQIDALMAQVPIDMIQLHGAETPDRVASIRTRTGLPVIKVVGLRSAEDLPAIEAHSAVADMILVDAKPPKGADLPGGNGITFDWTLLDGIDWSVPWMLAGGLVPENVAEAVAKTGARQVDTASGVESAPGVKCAAKMRAFVAAAQGLAGA